MEIPIYAREVARIGLSEANLKILGMMIPHKTVLEVGCSAGYMSKVIRDKLFGTVDGLEIDMVAAQMAKPYLRNLYVGSVEDFVILDQIKDQYDFIIFSDVLEHLVNPQQVLQKIKPKLKPTGMILASIPNVANWTLRIGLLLGQFNYKDLGLLDKTHLRFFTRSTARKLFEDAGYQILQEDYTLGFLPLKMDALKRFLTNLFPNFLAYQLIFAAKVK